MPQAWGLQGSAPSTKENGDGDANSHANSQSSQQTPGKPPPHHAAPPRAAQTPKQRQQERMAALSVSRKAPATSAATPSGKTQQQQQPARARPPPSSSAVKRSTDAGSRADTGLAAPSTPRTVAGGADSARKMVSQSAARTGGGSSRCVNMFALGIK